MKKEFTKHLDEGEVPIVTTDYKEVEQVIKTLNRIKLTFSYKKAHGGFVEIIASINKIRVGNLWYRELDGKKKFDEPSGIFTNDEIYMTVVRLLK